MGMDTDKTGNSGALAHLSHVPLSSGFSSISITCQLYHMTIQHSCAVISGQMICLMAAEPSVLPTATTNQSSHSCGLKNRNCVLLQLVSVMSVCETRYTEDGVQHRSKTQQKPQLHDFWFTSNRLEFTFFASAKMVHLYASHIGKNFPEQNLSCVEYLLNSKTLLGF